MQFEKRILARNAYHKLPGFLQEFARRFQVKEVWFPPAGTKLPETCPCTVSHDPTETPRYVAYVKAMIDGGERDPGKLKSFLQGLRSCGKPGQELIETIKKKVLRK